MSEFTRSIHFTAAFDRRDKDPSKDYGIHGCECIFTVSKGSKGITFAIFTNWMLPHVQAETDSPSNGPFPYLFHKPQPASVSYHDTKPQHEGQHAHEGCEVTGGVCYSDCSYTMGEGMFTKLVEGGSDALFSALEALYEEWLGEGAA